LSDNRPPETRDDQAPATLPIQPMPIRCKAGEHTERGVTMRMVLRWWRDGDTRRCRNCDECGADHEMNFCGIMTAQEIGRTPEEIALFGLRAAPAPALAADAGAGDRVRAKRDVPRVDSAPAG
jgi:hypothetical protein